MEEFGPLPSRATPIRMDLSGLELGCDMLYPPRSARAKGPISGSLPRDAVIRSALAPSCAPSRRPWPPTQWSSRPQKHRVSTQKQDQPERIREVTSAPSRGDGPGHHWGHTLASNAPRTKWDPDCSSRAPLIASPAVVDQWSMRSHPEAAKVCREAESIPTWSVAPCPSPT